MSTETLIHSINCVPLCVCVCVCVCVRDRGVSCISSYFVFSFISCLCIDDEVVVVDPPPMVVSYFYTWRPMSESSPRLVPPKKTKIIIINKQIIIIKAKKANQEKKMEEKKKRNLYTYSCNVEQSIRHVLIESSRYLPYRHIYRSSYWLNWLKIVALINNIEWPTILLQVDRVSELWFNPAEYIQYRLQTRLNAYEIVFVNINPAVRHQPIAVKRRILRLGLANFIGYQSGC